MVGCQDSSAIVNLQSKVTKYNVKTQSLLKLYFESGARFYLIMHLNKLLVSASLVSIYATSHLRHNQPSAPYWPTSRCPHNPADLPYSPWLTGLPAGGSTKPWLTLHLLSSTCRVFLSLMKTSPTSDHFDVNCKMEESQPFLQEDKIKVTAFNSTLKDNLSRPGRVHWQWLVHGVLIVIYVVAGAVAYQNLASTRSCSQRLNAWCKSTVALILNCLVTLSTC